MYVRGAVGELVGAHVCTIVRCCYNWRCRFICSRPIGLWTPPLFARFLSVLVLTVVVVLGVANTYGIDEGRVVVVFVERVFGLQFTDQLSV